MLGGSLFWELFLFFRSLHHKGEKYIISGILFKFAVDHKGLFGSDQAAAKVAGHELKGVIAYLNCGIPELHVQFVVILSSEIFLKGSINVSGWLQVFLRS